MDFDTIPEPARSPITTTDGLDRLFWKSWNPKKPIATITFVHGQSEHCSRYDSIFERFAKSRIQVVCFDLRGHGHSSGVRGHTPFDKMFEDIDLMYKKSDPDVPHFVFGHSMGGLLVVSWILSRQKLGKLPPLAGAIASGPFFALTNPIPGQGFFASFLSAISQTSALSNNVNPQWTSRDVEQIRKYAKDPLNHGKISFKSAKDCFEYGELCIQHASKFTTPVLFTHGGADLLTSPKATEQFFTGCSSSDKTLKIYPGWYHELHFEPQEASQEVLLAYENWIVDRVLSKKHAAPVHKQNSQQELKREVIIDKEIETQSYAPQPIPQEQQKEVEAVVQEQIKEEQISQEEMKEEQKEEISLDEEKIEEEI